MELLPIVVIIISFFDVKTMWKKGLKKEIAVFAILAVLTLVYGYYYLLNIHTASLVRNILDLLGIKY